MRELFKALSELETRLMEQYGVSLMRQWHFVALAEIR